MSVTFSLNGGSDIRDMMLEAVKRRFGDDRTPHPVEMLSDNSSCYIACYTRAPELWTVLRSGSELHCDADLDDAGHDRWLLHVLETA